MSNISSESLPAALRAHCCRFLAPAYHYLCILNPSLSDALLVEQHCGLLYLFLPHLTLLTTPQTPAPMRPLLLDCILIVASFRSN